MSYDSEKNQFSNEIITAVKLRVDKCRFTTDEYISAGQVTVTTAISSSGTGQSVTIQGGDIELFTDTSYLVIDDEIIQVDIVSANSVTITARAQFGTSSASHSAQTSAKIAHSGEVDGSCYDTPQTCSDPNSYQEGTYKELLFPSQTLINGEQGLNGLDGVKFSDAVVDIGNSLGKRGKVTLSIRDSVDDLASYDKLTLTYPDRYSQNGTRFGKQLARSVYFENRPMTVYTGFYDGTFNVDNMRQREYIVDTCTLNKNGVLSITGLDPLILTEDKKAKCPVISEGRLSADIDDASTTITLDPSYSDSFDYGDNGTTQYLRVDSEVIEVTVTGAYTFDIDVRHSNQPSTAQKDHSTGSTVQLVKHYDDEHVVDIIRDLLLNFTNIDSSFVGEYDDIKGAIPSLTLTAWITKPESVSKLLNELIMHADLAMWFDQNTQMIAIRYIPTYSQVDVTFDDDSNIGLDSFSYKRNLQVQHTRAPVYWNVVDITKTSGEENFAIGLNTVNAQLEIGYGLGEVNEKRPILSRWLHGTTNDAQIGASISDRAISRAQNPPLDIQFLLDASEVFTREDGTTVDIGSIVSVASRDIQTVSGQTKSQQYQIRSINEVEGQRFIIGARLYQLPVDENTFDFVIAESKEDYVLSDDFAPESSGNYNIYIQQGVVIGQVNNDYAFDTGSHVAGVRFTIVNEGQILGKGGTGGTGGFAAVPNFADGGAAADYSNGQDGLQGGNAFNAQCDVEIFNGSGLIYAGGGGAGGSYSSAVNSINDVPAAVLNAGNGGSGGAGYGTSQGGAGGQATVDGFLSEFGLDGMSGTQNGPGMLVISGGDYGESGGDGVMTLSDTASGFGGASGVAITTNGNTVTIATGNNSLNLKGAVI